MDQLPMASGGTRFVSVGGGKGGVGKSLVAVNLSVALAHAGHDVVLCDLDLGAPNLHLMMGLLRARPGITALLSADEVLEDALTDTVVPGLKLLAGTGGTVDAANVSHSRKLRILRRLRALRSDFVVIDVGAGVGYNALDFFELGQMRIIVATPQVTSMHDAYAFLKGAVLRTLKHHARDRSEADLLEPALRTQDRDKVKDVLLRIGESDPNFGEKVRRILARFGAYLVGNQVESPAQFGVFQAVARMAEDFLGIQLPILGCIPASARFADSVNQRHPFLAGLTPNQETPESKALQSIVAALQAGDLAPEEELLLELIEDGVMPEPVNLTGDPSSPVIPSGEKTVLADQSPVVEISDLPAAVFKPRVIAPRPRRPKVESADKKRKRALDRMGLRRKITLPGMTPSRQK